MTTTTNETQVQMKQAPDFYIFLNGGDNKQGGKPAGAAFAHKKGKGFTILIDGKRYAAFPPKVKTATPAATGEKGA